MRRDRDIGLCNYKLDFLDMEKERIRIMKKIGDLLLDFETT